MPPLYTKHYPLATATDKDKNRRGTKVLEHLLQSYFLFIRARSKVLAAVAQKVFNRFLAVFIPRKQS